MDSISTNPWLQQVQQQYAAQNGAQNGQGKNVFTDFVEGQTAVDHYPIPAGTTVVLIDLRAGKMWFKSKDGSGVPCPLRHFDIKEKIVTPPADPNQVTRAEVDKLSSEIEGVKADLEKLVRALTPGGEEKK